MAVHKVYAHFIILLCFHLPSYYVFATDTLIQGQSISLSDTIVSAGEVFELGFFSPGSSSNSYVGIWYRKIQTRTVVWVANRKFPITDSTATLTIRSDGNIAISFDQLYLMVTNVSSQGSTRAVLLDSGNLVLRDSNSDVLWESFDYPSHTFLPGMKIGIDKRRNKSWSLTSWRTTQDPGIGDFSLKLDSEASQQFSIMQGSKESWSSGSWSESAHIFSLVPEMRLNYLYFSYISNENESYFTFSVYNSSITSRCILDVSGQIKQLTMLESKTGWDLLWMQPKFSCDVSSVCGPFSVCSEKNYTTLPCECIQGFEPSSAQDWTEGRTFGGCVRKSTLQCHTGVAGGDKDKFLEMPHIQFPDNPQKSVARSVKECRSQCLRNCSCSAYAYNGDGCSLWIGSLYNTKLTDDGQIMCLKLASSELPATGSSGNKRLMLALVSGGAVFLILSFGFYLFYRWRKIRKQRGQNILLLDSSIKVSKNDSSGRKAPNPNRNDDSGLPLFSFSSVSAATDNFSLDNKLGEGGFGPVYKGKLLKGMSIAVKRLSTTSGQGLQELENEAKLIAKLQHKNLVKLLGCCLEKGEKILIYEFMPNKSLDSFLFDPYKQSLLDWDTRVTIIEGIAQGLLYLHQYSRLRIIHRDLKASNILLDADMNPKISDFGMARIFGGNQSQANTKHIVGTYGYMPPEYVLEGLFSIKSDVFSYGVLLLEILSGKRNTGFYKSNSLDLLGHAWELWNNGRARELADPILEEELSEATLIRYINIALLCVQENADDRPTMSEAVSMLINGATLLPSPKPPAFSNVRGVRNPNVDATAPEICSINGITISSVDGR